MPVVVVETAILLGGASLLTGLAGLGFGFYQFRKQKESEEQQKKMERQLRRKDDLEGLSDNLRELHDRILTLCEETIHPRSNEDMEFALHDFAKDVLAYYHSTGKNPHVQIQNVVIHHTGDREDVTLNDTTEVVEAYHEDNSSYILAEAYIVGSEEALRYVARINISEITRNILWTHAQLQTIRMNYQDLLNQFDSRLLEDIETAVDQLTAACYEQIFGHYDGVEFDPNDFDNPTEIEDAVYRTFVLSDDVYEAVDQIKLLADKIDEIQMAVVQTSFS